ncbi:hypothetical protein KGQ19_06040 [Catenulispora sp. NL8]|uniref:Uncharacterized protein n=1 Tax=Catenulispora pinistramenti TaxID=2705254 RepID=A0ABS5KJ59_9ACTN|nr:hypothetical protein [Catenulispora pinistramenti]MBS2546422.1 hypothetical protein [Catenulispora pinistramenti]
MTASHRDYDRALQGPALSAYPIAPHGEGQMMCGAEKTGPPLVAGLGLGPELLASEVCQLDVWPALDDGVVWPAPDAEESGVWAELCEGIDPVGVTDVMSLLEAVEEVLGPPPSGAVAGCEAHPEVSTAAATNAAAYPMTREVKAVALAHTKISLATGQQPPIIRVLSKAQYPFDLQLVGVEPVRQAAESPPSTLRTCPVM